MSNPTFNDPAIGFPVASKVEQGRLVTINKDGKVEHAKATGKIFGAVTELRDLSDPTSARTVAVHFAHHAVKLAVDGDATAIKAGDAVYAAADGKVSATGTVVVGVAARNGDGNRVLTVLNGLPIGKASE